MRTDNHRTGSVFKGVAVRKAPYAPHGSQTNNGKNGIEALTISILTIDSLGDMPTFKIVRFLRRVGAKRKSRSAGRQGQNFANDEQK
ncbi:hypothetical protein D3OALGA1CA_2129 [Olavius algarvensis associated proteobacterium Delta 3]|nr:hypothetical protein D3OALGB2SA_678 [Olavius algarvensis associated proteobacterium Delta 3]CAB5112830.1 hypothetical protein D3OALGA1CA_2129 [Olavius algarvensis associated proteobacterium Delta 3]